MAALSAPQAAIQNSLLAYVRSQEDAADRAGVRFLNATGQSAKGMYDTFKRLADQILYASREIDPYMQSHPLPAERVRALEGLAKVQPALGQEGFAGAAGAARPRARQAVRLPRSARRRRAPLSDQRQQLAARYARAIATYRFGNVPGAIAQIDALIQAQPQNPYFHELKGQALLEAGRAAEAIAPLRRAAQLAPNPALIQIMLGAGAARVEQQGRMADEAVTLLETATAARAGIAGSLRPDRDGLWPQGRPRARRSRLRAGRVHARRPEDGARARRPRQDPLPRRLAGLGQGGRHRQLQAAAPASA